MELLVRRHSPGVEGILGEFYVAGVRFSYSLERKATAIPAGRYPVILTLSGRVLKGALWSPRADHKLPELLDVPNRTAIRIHALNEVSDKDGDPAEAEGCIGVGFVRVGKEGIAGSRMALTQLLAEWHEPVWITVEDAPLEVMA